MSEAEMVSSGMLRGMIDAVEAVAGVKGRNLALRHANLDQYIDNPPDVGEGEDEVLIPKAHHLAMQKALTEVFGSKGSRVILVYIGEQTARIAFETMPGIFTRALKFVPVGLKKQALYRIVAAQAGKVGGKKVTVEFEGAKVIYTDPGCHLCDGQESDEPVCAFCDGFLLATAEWITGKKHRVKELECRASGHEACAWEIDEL